MYIRLLSCKRLSLTANLYKKNKTAEFVYFGNGVDCLIIDVTLALHSKSSQNVFLPEFKLLIHAV